MPKNYVIEFAGSGVTAWVMIDQLLVPLPDWLCLFHRPGRGGLPHPSCGN